MNNINEITLGNSLALKFECEIILKNCIIDITDDVYKNCIFTDNYIFFNSVILLKHIEEFKDIGNHMDYYRNIKYNIIITDGDKIYNMNNDDTILININDNKLYLNKTFFDIDNEITNIINNITIKKDEYSICFVITLKYVRGYDSYIKIYVDNIQHFYKNSFIIIIDNNSTYINDIKIVLKNYKNLMILTNTSDSKFEVGGYSFGLKWLIENNITDKYDYYVFTQDNLILKKKYDFNKLQFFNIYACSILEHREDFEIDHPNEKRHILQQYNISCRNTNICWGSNFVIHKNKIHDLYYKYIKNTSLKTKDDSCIFERIMGFFIKELEQKNFNIEGFLADRKCYHSNFKYFKKIHQSKNENDNDNTQIPILKNNIITCI